MLSLLRAFALVFLLYTLSACADPVEPVYRFETGFLLIEGRIADEEGYSEISLSRNEILFDNYTLSPVPGSVVSSIDSDGQEVTWESVEASNRYRAPEGWVAQAGKSYRIRIVTPQGEVVESNPEPVPTSVPMLNPRVVFEQEAYFSTGRDRFIPAFRLLIDLEDPADEANFYQFNYTTWESIDVCASCERARWRNGVCIAGPDTRFVSRWDYLCDMPCWIFAQGRGRNILSDAFINGNRVENIEAGRFDYERNGGLLFVLEQFNTSRAAYEFNQVLHNLAEGGSGLNAPLPAALVGNLTDVSENNTNVLGFVSVTAVNTDRVFIQRDTIDGESLPYDGSINLEPVLPAPPQAPCVGVNRSTERPVGWPQ